MPHQVDTILGFAELTAQPPWMLAFSSQCITNHDDLCLGRKNVPANGQFLDMCYILVLSSPLAIGPCASWSYFLAHYLIYLVARVSSFRFMSCTLETHKPIDTFILDAVKADSMAQQLELHAFEPQI